MNSRNRDDRESGELSYRLRKNVRYLQDHGRPLFMLSYPLKAVRMHPAWIPVGERFSPGKFVSLSELSALLAEKAGDRLRLFLDDLVRKGFLDTRGTLPLPRIPPVSVIIPVHNRPYEIRACIEALLRLDYPREKLEILVVDDASTDHTPEVVSGFPVTLIRLSKNKQAPFCRNLGARRAGGEILAFIDSDCLPSPSWLKELVPLFIDRTLAAVGGKVDSYYERKRLDRYEQRMSSLNRGNGPRRSSKEDPFFYVPSCNLLVWKKVFLSVGGFREELVVGEDVDLCWRLQDQGHPLEYRPAGTVYHRHRNSLKAFCSRRFEYGTSEPWLQHRHSHRIKQLILSPPGFFFWALLYLALRFLSWPLLAGSVGVLLLDSGARFFKLDRKHFSLSFSKILAASFRSHLALFYHWSAFFSRYYLFLALPFVFLLPAISLTLLGLHLLTSGVEYLIKKPRLNFFSFFWYFTLDQLSYQLGVWWGCLKNGCFRPVNPLLAASPLFKQR
jgi:mycofactocin system glycosyltransferase